MFLQFFLLSCFYVHNFIDQYLCIYWSNLFKYRDSNTVTFRLLIHMESQEIIPNKLLNYTIRTSDHFSRSKNVTIIFYAFCLATPQSHGTGIM